MWERLWERRLDLGANTYEVLVPLASTDGPFRRILSVNAPMNDSLQLVDVDVSGADRAVVDARPSPPGGDRVRPSWE